MSSEIRLLEGKQSNRRRKHLLNTKGCCFLCLELLVFKTEEEEPSKNENEKGTSISLKSLNRYLKINSGDYVAVTTVSYADILQQEPGKEEIKVDLCETCAKITTKFTKTFASLEMIQAEANYWLKKIHQQISDGSKRPELIQTYSKRMTSDTETLKQLANVDKLRKDILKKSSELENDFSPEVHLFRLKTTEKYCRSQSAQETDLQTTARTAPSLDQSDNEWESGYEVEDSPSPLLENKSIKTEDMVDSNIRHLTTATTSSKSETKKRGKRYNFNSTTRKYDCVECTKAFRSRSNASDHYSLVHLKRIFKCESCHLILKHQGSLIRHRKICSGIRKKILDRTFTCSICAKGFTASSSLLTHQKTVHLKQRNYSCNICSKTFQRSGDLKAHKAAIHFGRKFDCKTCNKPFKWKGNHKAHESVCRSSDSSCSLNKLKKEVI